VIILVLVDYQLFLLLYKFESTVQVAVTIMTVEAIVAVGLAVRVPVVVVPPDLELRLILHHLGSLLLLADQSVLHQGLQVGLLVVDLRTADRLFALAVAEGQESPAQFGVLGEADDQVVVKLPDVAPD
jgi:hypothetical protein